jgi:hypothetical protein
MSRSPSGSQPLIDVRALVRERPHMSGLTKLPDP